MESAVYYPRRAPEYDEIYARPERQEDLAVLKTKVPELLAGLDVLEIACGTGWWTQWIVPAAASVLGTDLSPEMLAQAQAKAWPSGGVTFRCLDAYDLGTAGRGFGALFAGFFWSHVPRERLPHFLSGLQSALAPGARCVFLDNRYVPGSSTPVSREDARGNTWQERTLRDGTIYEVLKNFPPADEVRRELAPLCRNVEVLELPYYWLAWGELREAG